MGHKHRLTLAIMIVVITIISVNCINGEHKDMLNNSENQHNVPIDVTVSPFKTIPYVTTTEEPDEYSSIEPTRLNIILEEEKIRPYSNGDSIEVQLYFKGEPLKKKGVKIVYEADNTSLVTMYPRTNNTTDDNGVARLKLWPTETGYGNVKFTAYYYGRIGNVSNSTFINISNWGGIGGLVFDREGVGIPNANVSLWNCHYNDSCHLWEKDDLLDIPENPQLTNYGSTAPSGQYAFASVLAGTYIVVAEKNGYNNSSIVSLDQADGIYSSSTRFVTLSDYEYNHSDYTPMVLPTPTLKGNTIWGIVEDWNKVSIPNTNVSLWYCIYNTSTRQWDKTTMVDVPGNPQLSNNGKTGAIGEYRFDNLSHGTYYIEDNYVGHYAHAIVHLDSNIAVAYVIQQGFYIDFPPMITSQPLTFTPSP